MCSICILTCHKLRTSVRTYRPADPAAHRAPRTAPVLTNTTCWAAICTANRSVSTQLGNTAGLSIKAIDETLGSASAEGNTMLVEPAPGAEAEAKTKFELDGFTVVEYVVLYFGIRAALYSPCGNCSPLPTGPSPPVADAVSCLSAVRGHRPLSIRCCRTSDPDQNTWSGSSRCGQECGA